MLTSLQLWVKNNLDKWLGCTQTFNYYLTQYTCIKIFPSFNFSARFGLITSKENKFLLSIGLHTVCFLAFIGIEPPLHIAQRLAKSGQYRWKLLHLSEIGVWHGWKSVKNLVFQQCFPNFWLPQWILKSLETFLPPGFPYGKPGFLLQSCIHLD